MEQTFQLPDGTQISLGTEQFKAAECLFQPSLIGSDCKSLSELLSQSYAETRKSVDVRWDMLGSVVLSGGTTLTKGFADRVSSDINNFRPAHVKHHVIAPPMRAISAWIGGSILASLSTFQSIWISKQAYDEQGPQIVHAMCK